MEPHQYERNAIEATLKARERDVLLRVLNKRLMARGGFKLNRSESDQFEMTYYLTYFEGMGGVKFFDDFTAALEWSLDYLMGLVEPPDVPNR